MTADKNIFEILKWTTMNPLEDQTERGSGDPRRGTSKRFINRTLASMYSKNCLVNTDEFYGIVVLVYRRDVANINLPSTAMSTMTGEGTTNSNHNVYKVYVPELECRPYPMAINDPILATYQEVVAITGEAYAPGDIVRIQYGDLGNMKNPQIVGKSGAVPGNFLPSKMEQGLEVEFLTKTPALAQEIAPFTGPTPQADRLRAFIVSHANLVEKGNELSSGGDLNSEIVDATISVLATIVVEFKNKGTDIQITLTGGNDKYHQTLDSNSRHKRGNAMDFTVFPNNGATIRDVETILQRFVIGNNNKFRYLNEYDNPTKHATGKHFHMSWGLGTEAQAQVDAAFAIADLDNLQPLAVGGVKVREYELSLERGYSVAT